MSEYDDLMAPIAKAVDHAQVAFEERREYEEWARRRKADGYPPRKRTEEAYAEWWVEQHEPD
jgi:hypothetical protein